MKAMSRMKSVNYALAVIVSMFMIPAANAVDFSSVTGAFDTAGITTGVLAIGALMMAVVAVVWGVRKLLGFGR